MMKSIAAALLLATTQAGMGTVPASKVCINNSAGFVMYFYFENDQRNWEDSRTDKYSINNVECLDIKEIIPDVQNNDVIDTRVKAVAGKRNLVDTPIVYNSNAGVASFTCRGMTLSYDCTLNGGSDSSNGCRQISEFEYDCGSQQTPVDPVDPTPVDPVDPTPVDPVDPTPVDPTPVDPQPSPSDHDWFPYLRQLFDDTLWAQLSHDVNEKMGNNQGYDIAT